MQKQLNLLSPDFDPELALDVPQIRLPFPSENPLDNITRCRRLLPQSAEAAIADERHRKLGSKHQLAQKSAAAAPAMDSATVTDAEAPVTVVAGSPSVDDGAAVPLIKQWGASFREGPLSMLRSLHHRTVRVVIRRQHGLRAVCEGQLQLFDRHLNLLLVNGSEEAVLQPPKPLADLISGKRWPRAVWQRRYGTNPPINQPAALFTLSP